MENRAKPFRGICHASKGEFGAGDITDYWIGEYKTLPNHSTLHLQVHNGRMIWGFMITDGNVEGVEAELFLTCILLIKGK